jgi:hypothetical protein
MISADVAGECSNAGLVTMQFSLVGLALMSGQRVLEGIPIGLGDAGKTRSAVGSALERMYPRRVHPRCPGPVIFEEKQRPWVHPDRRAAPACRLVVLPREEERLVTVQLDADDDLEMPQHSVVELD